MSRVSGNFGEGIARSAVLPDRTGQVLAYGEKRRASKKAQESKDDEDFNKYAGDINVKGVHRLDQDAANENAMKTVAQLAQLRQANPNNWRNMVPQVMMDFQAKQNEYLSRNKYLTKLQDDYIENNKLGLTTPAQKAAYEAMTSGNWGSFKGIQSDAIGSFKYNPENNGISMNFVPNFNKAAYDKQILQDDYQTDLSLSTENIPGAPGGAKAVVSRFNTPDEKIADFNMRALLGEPGYAKRAEAEFMSAGRLPANYASLPETDEQNPMNPNTKFGVLYAENLKDIQRNTGTKTDVSIQKPPKEAKDKAATPDYGLDDGLKNGTIKENEKLLAVKDAGKGKGITYEAQARYSSDVATSAYTIVQADSKTFNLADGKYFKDQAQFNFKPGSIKVIGITKDGKHSYQAVVFGQAIDSSIPLDANGQPQFNLSTLSDAQAKAAYKDVFIPLDKVDNTLRTKYKTSTKWAYEAVDRLNREESKKTETTTPDKKAETLRNKYGY